MVYTASDCLKGTRAPRGFSPSPLPWKVGGGAEGPLPPSLSAPLRYGVPQEAPQRRRRRSPRSPRFAPEGRRALRPASSPAAARGLSLPFSQRCNHRSGSAEASLASPASGRRYRRRSSPQQQPPLGARRTMLREAGKEKTPPGLWLPWLLLLFPSSAVHGENTELPTFSATAGLHSVLEDTVSPAFSATVIIIVTVIISGSAYLCFLKYICAGCCKSTQVVPVRRLDPSRSEEQV
ncbi:uncharacterized protein LOC114595446 [Podarcis muralis]